MTTNILIAIALALATPFFIFFGWLSDRIGRKPIILAACALAALTYFPAFKLMSQAANPALAEAQERAPLLVVAAPESCSVQFDPIGKNKFESSGCDVAQSTLAKAGVTYSTTDELYRIKADGLTADSAVFVGDKQLVYGGDPAAYRNAIGAALNEAGYPEKADPEKMNKPLVVAVLFYLVLLVTAAYGPIAAMLVELFPARIRYTSMSLPYHIGNGWFGGFLPTTAFAMVAATGDIYYGLWYPVLVAALTVIVGLILLPETFKRDIDA